MRRIAIIFSALITCASALIAWAGAPEAKPEAGELMQSSPAAVTPVVSSRRQQVWMEVTAYCACTKCCGPNAHGITASGLPVTYNFGRFAAADSAVAPIGSQISVPGYHEGREVPVIDHGGAIKGNKLDVFFPTHEQALKWGRRWVLVTIETPERGSVDPV